MTKEWNSVLYNSIYTDNDVYWQQLATTVCHTKNYTFYHLVVYFNSLKDKWLPCVKDKQKAVFHNNWEHGGKSCFQYYSHEYPIRVIRSLWGENSS